MKSTMEQVTSELELSHKALIESIRRNNNHALSAHSFVNLFLLRTQLGLRIYCEDSIFAVNFPVKGKNAWFFPCASSDEARQFIRKLMYSRDLSLHYLRGADAQWLDASFPDQFELSRDEASDEYVLSIADYLALEGSTYSRLRRRIRRIEREHSVRVEPITDENLARAVNIIESWETSRGSDAKVARDALENRRTLELDGMLLYIDDTATALVVGFELDFETVDILVGKCTQDAPRGCIFLALWEYLNLFAADKKYCNVEEDLGIPGLRIMKEEMKPAFKNIVYTAIVK